MDVLTRLRGALAVFGVVLLAVSPLYADEVAGVPLELLGGMFTGAEQFTEGFVLLSQPQVDRLLKTTDWSPDSRLVTYAVATTSEGDTLGYALADRLMGRYHPFRFAMAVSRDLEIKAVRVYDYEPPYGGEVRERSFTDQYTGLTPSDPIRVGRDIDAVSGATISSGSLTEGVRTRLGLLKVILGR